MLWMCVCVCVTRTERTGLWKVDNFSSMLNGLSLVTNHIYPLKKLFGASFITYRCDTINLEMNTLLLLKMDYQIGCWNCNGSINPSFIFKMDHFCYKTQVQHKLYPFFFTVWEFKWRFDGHFHFRSDECILQVLFVN